MISLGIEGDFSMVDVMKMYMQAWNAAGKVTAGINIAEVVDSIENVDLTGDMFINNPAQDPVFLGRLTAMANAETAKTEGQVLNTIMQSQMMANQSGGDTFTQKDNQQKTRQTVQKILQSSKARVQSKASLMMQAATSKEIASRDRENQGRLFNPAATMDEQTMASIDQMSRTEMKGPQELDTGVNVSA